MCDLIQIIIVNTFSFTTTTQYTLNVTEALHSNNGEQCAAYYLHVINPMNEPLEFRCHVEHAHTSIVQINNLPVNNSTS